MSRGVSVASGPIDRIRNLHNSSGHVYLVCPDRGGACPYALSPDRPDDYPLEFLLDHPYCSVCGSALEIVPRGGYDGEVPDHRNLDQEGPPVEVTL